MNNEDCSICGLDINEKYKVKLSCGHIFHYECLLKTFLYLKKSNIYNHKYVNSCPYCRKKCGLLPIVGYCGIF